MSEVRDVFGGREEARAGRRKFACSALGLVAAVGTLLGALVPAAIAVDTPGVAALTPDIPLPAAAGGTGSFPTGVVTAQTGTAGNDGLNFSHAFVAATKGNAVVDIGGATGSSTSTAAMTTTLLSGTYRAPVGLTVYASTNSAESATSNATNRQLAANFCSSVSPASSLCSGSLSPSGTSVSGSYPTNTPYDLNGRGPLQATAVNCVNPQGMASNGDNGEFAYTGCSGSDKIAVCRPDLGCSPSTQPYYQLLSPVGSTAVPSGVANLGSNREDAFNGTTGPCATATTALYGLVNRVTPGNLGSTRFVVVADSRNNRLVALMNCYQSTSLWALLPAGTTGLETPSNTLALPAGCRPANVATYANASNNSTVAINAYAYVACPGTGQVAVGTFDTTTGAWVGAASTRTLPGTTPAPYGVAVGHGNTSLVVTDSRNNQATVYTKSTAIRADLTTGITATTVATGSVPNGVAIARNNLGNVLNAFVANQLSGTVTAIDPPGAPEAAEKCRKTIGGKPGSARGVCAGLVLDPNSGERKREVRSAIARIRRTNPSLVREINKVAADNPTVAPVPAD